MRTDWISPGANDCISGFSWNMAMKIKDIEDLLASIGNTEIHLQVIAFSIKFCHVTSPGISRNQHENPPFSRSLGDC